MLYCCQENNYLHPIFNELRNIEEDFQKGEVTKDTLTSFYSAVLLLYSNLILFSDFNKKSYKFAKEASRIHLKMIDEIKSIEAQAVTKGNYVQNKDKYLKIWKQFLKNIILLCSNYSKQTHGSSKPVTTNKKWFTVLCNIFSSLSTIMLKRRSWPNVSIKWSRNSATEDEISNQSQSPASENSEKLSGRFKVSSENLHVAITIIVFVIGITLALTLFG
ncbi:hypothetical protein [Microcoleus sp. B4-C1]|uniref:hypothetical protein n=1 Tax=Microcoleus sp. B4-C1 TaxID=2818660 RepID=UPI002FD0CC20